MLRLKPRQRRLLAFDRRLQRLCKTLNQMNRLNIQMILLPRLLKALRATRTTNGHFRLLTQRLLRRLTLYLCCCRRCHRKLRPMLRLTPRLALVTRRTDNRTHGLKRLIHPVNSLGQRIPVGPNRKWTTTHNPMIPPGQKFRKELHTKQGAKMETRSSLGMTAQTAEATQEAMYTPMISVLPTILALLQMVANPPSPGIMKAKLSQPYQATEPSSHKATAPSLRWQSVLRQHSKDKSSKSRRWKTLS